MELFETIWTFMEFSAFLLVILIFFKDPIRRWNFFGYRPTAVMGIYDPCLEKVLLSKVNGAWSFNQGGMYENNIYSTVRDILGRELGIPENRFKLVYTKPLGTVRITNKQLLTRARISTISLFSHLRGKGFLGCFVRTNLDNIEPELHKGAGIQSVRVVSFSEAKALVKKYTTEEHQPRKQQLILAMLAEMETYVQGVKKWESENLSRETDKLSHPADEAEEKAESGDPSA